MPRSQSDIVGAMRASLAVADPDLDTTIGSTTRKIIDVVAEVVAESSGDQFLLDYQYDVDTKTGSSLDDFVTLFGFTRLEAKRAVGTVTFERTVAAAANQNVFIPLGTQVASRDTPPVVVATTQAAVMGEGVLSVDVPVRAVIGGTNGNLTANAIGQWVTPVAGITSFTNTAGFTGGTAEETDDQLRARFKRTVFRNMAGTEQMFLGIALEDSDTSLANVVGAAKVRFEQIDLVGGTGQSSVQDSQYVYPSTAVFGRDIDAGDIFGEGVQFDFNPVPTPIVTSLDGGLCPDGVYDLSFAYVPLASRNDPALGITNRVDVYVNGVREVEASETLLWRTAYVFSANPADPYYVGNFERTEFGGGPTVGNYFIPFSFTPVSAAASNPDADDFLTIGGTDYHKHGDYFLVNDVSRDGLMPRSHGGLEWVATANGPEHAIPANNTSFLALYRYNEVPTVTEAAIQGWRMVTQDVRVHQAHFVRLNLYLAVIYEPGLSKATVDTEIERKVSEYLGAVDFDGAVQVSDILQVVHNVTGVDAVRFKTSADGGPYGWWSVSGDGLTQLTHFVTNGRADDILLADNEVPALNNIIATAKAQNSFGQS